MANKNKTKTKTHPQNDPTTPDAESDAPRAKRGAKKGKSRNKKIKQCVMPGSHIVSIAKDSALFDDCRISRNSAEVIKDIIEDIYKRFEQHIESVVAAGNRKRANIGSFYSAMMLMTGKDINKDVVNIVSDKHAIYVNKRAAKSKSKAKKEKKNKNADSDANQSIPVV
jgi:hypothetical protein